MARGAPSADVLQMVAGNGLRIALTGIAIGLAGSAALTRSLTAAPLWSRAGRSGAVPGPAVRAGGGAVGELRGAGLTRESFGLGEALRQE